MPSQPSLCLITPALADARNGNWQTAKRWAKMLSEHFTVRLMKTWDGVPADLMIALHARRSADSIAAWAQALPDHPLIVTLTGTDLYRDINTDTSAQRSLALAHKLIVLQELGPMALPTHLRHKCEVCFQSTSRRRPQQKTARHLRVLAVGHLRDEKSPETFIGAARQLQAHPDLYFDHIGACLEKPLCDAAQELAASNPHYRWLGSLPYPLVRQRISRAHLLVHPSRMEGGAHVVMEAIASGTPVLASRIDGNIGMLGADYAGYFEHGGVTELADLILRCRREPAFLAQLGAQCAARAHLFEPEHERSTLIRISTQLLGKQ
jgi:putative glycosyltransferase (TIGR04348 family)